MASPSEGDADLAARLKTVQLTLKGWVQQCLAREEQGQKLQNGGIKCRVHARWSKGIDERLSSLIVKGYGGKLSADCKETETEKPNLVSRNERWLVEFDMAAVQTFLENHPEVLDPPEAAVRQFVEEFAQNAEIENTRVKDMYDLMEAKFGPLRRSLLERAKAFVKEAIAMRLLSGKQKAAKRSTPNVSREQAVKKQRIAGIKKEVVTAGGDAKYLAYRIETQEDVHWASSVLAPLGLSLDGKPVICCPESVIIPLLQSLRQLTAEILKDAVKKSDLIQTVKAYKQNSNEQVSKAAKEVLSCWKAAYALAASNGSSGSDTKIS